MTTGATAGRGFAAGDMAVALGVLALGFVVLWQVWEIPVSPLYARVGPTAAPYLAAFGLIAMGALLALQALRGGWQPEEEREASPDYAALGWVAAGLALNVLTIGPLGFTLASVLLFICVARGFGSRNMLRDAAIGFTFATIAYLGFAKALNINIGAGLIENAIEQALRAVWGR
jgi:putative tricarboxylic transport membrane protein